ncbi:MAG: hypothetical protein ACTHM6_18750 [Tepidisphaeraceae bacterium]
MLPDEFTVWGTYSDAESDGHTVYSEVGNIYPDCSGFASATAEIDYYFTVSDGDETTTAGTVDVDFGASGDGEQDGPSGYTDVVLTLDEVSGSSSIHISDYSQPDGGTLSTPSHVVTLTEGAVYHVHLSVTSESFDPSDFAYSHVSIVMHAH